MADAAGSAGTTVKVTASSNVAFSGTNADAIQDALENAGISLSTHCSSKTAWTEYTLTFNVDANGIVSAACDKFDLD